LPGKRSGGGGVGGGGGGGGKGGGERGGGEREERERERGGGWVESVGGWERQGMERGANRTGWRASRRACKGGGGLPPARGERLGHHRGRGCDPHTRTRLSLSLSLPLFSSPAAHTSFFSLLPFPISSTHQPWLARSRRPASPRAARPPASSWPPRPRASPRPPPVSREMGRERRGS